MGLLFPWLILANALFLVFWLIVRDRYFLFSMGVIILGFAEVSSIIGMPWGQLNHDDSSELTLVTFNMRRLEPFHNKQQTVNSDVLTEILGAYNADIICLQEVPSTYKEQEQIRAAFTKNLAMEFTSMSASKSLGIISKYPLEDTGYEYFTNNANGILWGTVKTPFGPLAVYSFHLQTNQISDLADQVVNESPSSVTGTLGNLWSMLRGYKNAALIRNDQGQRINQLVKEQTLPFILGGDLNDVPQSSTYYVTQKGMQDAFKSSGQGLGITYAGHLPGLRIDYVFAGPRIKVNSNFVGEKTFSDHYPVVAKISMPK